MGSKGLNTKQVGSLFGVNESTVRRWAMSGKIKCSSSAGGHRKFSFKNIISFSESNRVSINPKVLEDSLDKKKNVQDILGYSLNHETDNIESILVNLYLSGVTLSIIMDDYIEPVLVQIQKKLDDGKISVAEEHIARKIVSKSLGNFKNSITSIGIDSGKNVLCLNLENDIPDLPIDMIQILLESINFNVDNCGSHTSIIDLKKLLQNKKYHAIFIYMCDRQCCTSTVKDNNIVEIQAFPESNDIIGLKDIYLNLDISNTEINIVRDTISSGQQISGIGYKVTSSYSNGSLIRQ